MEYLLGGGNASGIVVKVGESQRTFWYIVQGQENCCQRISGNFEQNYFSFIQQ